MEKDRADFSQPAILDFHRTAGDGDPENDIIMNRSNRVRTTSITSIAKLPTSSDMYFQDILSGKEKEGKLKLKAISDLD